VKPWAKVEDFMPDSGEAYQRTCVKADWIKQLLELDPEARFSTCSRRNILAEHPGKA
jgi:hypothetical protein